MDWKRYSINRHQQFYTIRCHSIPKHCDRRGNFLRKLRTQGITITRKAIPETHMTWQYQDTPVETLPEECVGFVYQITNNLSGRKYIGKKLAKFSKTTYKTVKQKNGIKKRKKIRTKVDSDWREYYGSSPELTADVNTLGTENFSREILYYCKSKSECSYIEAREQFARRVLESTDYYNGHIQVRVHGSHIKDKL